MSIPWPQPCVQLRGGSRRTLAANLSHESVLGIKRWRSTLLVRARACRVQATRQGLAGVFHLLHDGAPCCRQGARAYGPGPVPADGVRATGAPRTTRCEEATSACTLVMQGSGPGGGSARHGAGRQGALHAHGARSPAPKARQSSTHCACA